MGQEYAGNLGAVAGFHTTCGGKVALVRTSEAAPPWQPKSRWLCI